MVKCNFNKFANQLYRNHTLAWVFSCKYDAFFTTPFPKNISEGLLLHIQNFCFNSRLPLKIKSKICKDR